MANPYTDLPSRNFWRSGTAESAASKFPDLFRPRFPISQKTRIATAGSCFAQHVGRHLRSLGYDILDAEPPPFGLDGDEARRFGYDLYSARHGNIYTVRQLLQLAREAFGEFSPGDAIWQRNGRYYDALRPTVEPEGLGSADAVRRHRAQHLVRFREILTKADLIVFTMGLIEAWVHAPTGTVYPTAPGVVADSASRDDIVLHSFTFNEIQRDLIEFRKLVSKINRKSRVLLTVSPVPLTATATDNHVLVASMHAKSTLRAVAAEVRDKLASFDYFPSYEIIAGHPSRGRFYAPNLREVTAEGVACVMRHFTAAYGAPEAETITPPLAAAEATGQMDQAEAAERVVCDEMLLDAFGPKTSKGAA